MGARKNLGWRGPQRSLREVDKAFIKAVMFELGILPLEKTDLDMRRALKQLLPEEARILKRKFRKLWRAALRRETDRVNVDGTQRVKENRATRLASTYGIGKHQPSRTERNARKALVFDYVWHDHVESLVRRFENPSTQAESTDEKDEMSKQK